MPKGDLSELRRKFVEAHMGRAADNATEAARLAGYKGNDATLAATASRLLKNDKILAAIDARVADDPAVLDRMGLMRFWSTATSDVNQKMPDRLKASELLGKSQAVFVERKEITGKDGGPIETQAKADPRLEKLDDAEFDEVEAALDEFIDTCAIAN